MKLDVLIKNIGATVKSTEDVGDFNSSEIVIEGLTSDSREVSSGYLFAALSGTGTTGSVSSEGIDFVQDAVDRGAVCILTENTIEGLDVAQVLVTDIKKNFALLAAFFYGEPSEKLSLVGVTGTNGKTTTSYLIESVFKEAGFNVGVMGTVEYRYGDVKLEATFTTPQAPLLQKVLHDMVESGTTHSIMEISSHSLSEHRVDGCSFGVKVFTNLTQDHMDYHHTMEEYFKAKERLFTDYSLDAGLGVSVINVDDEYGVRIAGETPNIVLGYSLTDKTAKIHARSFEIDEKGISADVATPRGDVNVVSSFVGEHNLYNIMAAIGAGCALDISALVIEKGINNLKGVRGRLMRVDSNKSFSAFVDYAHTPDALERAVKTVSAFTKGRVITVFGCGGDRDKTKRPLMGKVVAGLTDIAIVTSDNPRTEEPLEIIKDVEEGMGVLDKFSSLNDIGAKGYVAIVDRKVAIEGAVSIAKEGDTILLAGKGHEDYQIIGREKIHFDDVEILAEALGN